jgi:hypothetical protein
MTIPFAFIAAFGVFMFVDALRPRAPRITLMAPDERPVTQRLLDTLFVPAAERVLTLGRVDLRTHKSDLARRLARANYPPPFAAPEVVMSYRLFTAILFAVFGGIFGLLVGLGAATFPLMLALAVFGWAMPDRTIANAERDRKEQLMLDAASTMDRLAIHVSSGSALPMAIRSVAEKPGGAWVAECRKFAAYYATDGDFEVAADKVMEQSGRLSEIVRVFERLKAANEMGGGGTGKALRQMAADARLSAKLVIAERGYKNAVLMVIPAFFAIIAIMIILVAPGAVKMISVIGG